MHSVTELSVSITHERIVDSFPQCLIVSFMPKKFILGQLSPIYLCTLSVGSWPTFECCSLPLVFSVDMAPESQQVAGDNYSMILMS